MKSLLFKLETRTIFYPMRKNWTPVSSKLKEIVQDLYFYTQDGIKLNAWYIEPTFGKPVVMYFHGQAENISYYQEPLEVLVDNGYGVFALDYRGHGKSEGEPTEFGVYQDAEEALMWILSKGVKAQNVIVWGRSMGGAIAAELATRYDLKGVILESTFTNIKDAASSILELENNHEVFSPTRKMFFRLAKILPTTQEFNTKDKLSKIKSPILIAHSKNDSIISYKLAQLNADANPKAKLFISDKGSHDYSDWFFAEALCFIESL